MRTDGFADKEVADHADQVACCDAVFSSTRILQGQRDRPQQRGEQILSWGRRSHKRDYTGCDGGILVCRSRALFQCLQTHIDCCHALRAIWQGGMLAVRYSLLLWQRAWLDQP